MKRIFYFFAAATCLFNQINAQTDTATLQRDFQLTFITPLGTNGIDAYRTVNKVSVNILAGVSRGVKGIEGAGFANVTLRDMHGVQGAGFTNVVLGETKGVQGSGFANYSRGLYGAQCSGFCNVNLDSATGGQFTGFANYNHRSFRGIQGSGFANVVTGDLKGVQGTGFANVTCGNVKGAQFAGFANIATGDVNGVQASGFINVAKRVKGVQLGFINIADSVAGASVGFFSFVKKGLHQVELSADEMFYTNISFRTGMQSFYNIFSTGISVANGAPLWQIGYGAGTSLRLGNNWYSDLSVTGYHISKGAFYTGTSELYRLYLGMEYKFSNKVALAGGPTFNVYLSDALPAMYQTTYNEVVPYHAFDFTTSSGYNYKGWLGARIALRFL